MSSWSPTSWRRYPAEAQVPYPDSTALNSVLGSIADSPPLVFPGEIERLRAGIAAAARGETFILHGGDCVERFADCNPETISNKLKILLQMSVVLTYASRTPVLRIGRIAGQYFKPRSSATETVDGREVLTYRGDTVHDIDPQHRQPVPDRLEQGYFHAAATLNYIRAMISGGFADLHHPHRWDLGEMARTDAWEDYRQIVDQILDAIHFMESFGGVNRDSLGNIDFFVSHEALHLPYETALTRTSPDHPGCYYNFGAHMVWIGERTRALDGAHIEYARGISNPIGVKVGPNTSSKALVATLEALDPDNQPGRIVLISRLGAERVRVVLPPLIAAVKESGRTVAWSCDPMHGNTVTVGAQSRKTRRFQDVLTELSETFDVHRESGSRLAGVHFELTGEDVTECVGGAVPLTETDLSRNYRSYCDPRLNYSQSLETAFLIARFLREE